MLNENFVIFSLPLVDSRIGHTQNENLICGGGLFSVSNASAASCIMWNSKSGLWAHSHTLTDIRHYHMSWASSSGVLLLGGEKEELNGWDPVDTTELVTENGVSKLAMRKIIRYINSIHF